MSAGFSKEPDGQPPLEAGQQWLTRSGVVLTLEERATSDFLHPDERVVHEQDWAYPQGADNPYDRSVFGFELHEDDLVEYVGG